MRKSDLIKLLEVSVVGDPEIVLLGGLDSDTKRQEFHKEFEVRMVPLVYSRGDHGALLRQRAQDGAPRFFAMALLIK